VIAEFQLSTQVELLLTATAFLFFAVFPEREIIGFSIPKEQLEKLKEKFLQFENREKKLR